MKRHSRYAMGAVLVAILGGGAVVALAQPETQPDTPVRFASKDRLFAQFDTNGDGKITQAEIDAVLAKRFAEASGGSATLTKSQFETLRPDDRAHGSVESLYKKIDWNSDGQVDRDEFMTAERVRFNMMDRKGTGEISCAPREKAAGTTTADAGKGEAGKERGGHWRGHGGGRFMKAGFCAQFDGNKDGKVTRAEFDAATSARFAQFAKAGFLTLDGFTKLADARVQGFQDKRFDRLDSNNDGKLTLNEFTAPQDTLFKRLDKDKKGYITKDDVKSGMHHRFGKGQGDRHNWKHDEKPGAQTPG